MDQAPGVEKNEIKDIAQSVQETESKLTVPELEAKLTDIDLEIVKLGENIEQSYLDVLTEVKQRLAIRLAKLKGEPIEKDTYDTSL